MQKRTKKGISIIAIAAAVVFCIVVFALCVFDVQSKHAVELSAGEHEIYTTTEKSEPDYEPEKVLSAEQTETVYKVTPMPEKPKTVQTNTKSEAVQISESIVTPLADVGESNSNAVAPVANVVQEEIIESGLEGEIDYDTSEIDEVLLFSLYNNNTEYKVKARDRNITEAIIPSTYKGLPVTEIASNGFGNCKELTNVILPYGLTRINSMAFFMCVKLQRLYIPETVTWINNSAFGYCDNLTELILPSNTELRNTILRPNPRQEKQVVE